MSIYTPTYLYTKQHLVTGMMYFGKTIKNPETYHGSGTYWLRHIKKYGKDKVATLWYCLFTDKTDLTSFATSFSEQHNIVESKLWANLAPENGTDGGPRINHHFKIINAKPRPPRTKEWCDAISFSKRGKATKQYPVQVDNICFKSITDCGRHFGKTDAAIHYWIKTGKAIRL